MNISLNTPMSDYDRGVQAGKAVGRTEVQARIEELEAALKRLIHWCDERDVLRDESARAKAALVQQETEKEPK